MRTARIALVLAGTLALAWGARLLAPQLTTVSAAAWLLGGPVLHDALLAPAVALVGLGVAAAVPAAWRPLVATGLVVSGTLALVAVPLLLRPSAGPPNPGLSDRHPLGLAAALGAVWLVVLAVGVARTRRRR